MLRKTAEKGGVMSFPKWCLFFDFHTMPANPDVGKAFDFEAIADRFQQAGVQYVMKY